MLGAMSADLLRHELLVHGSDGEFAQRIVPFLQAGIDDGETVLAVAGEDEHALLQDLLGRDREHVTLVDHDSVYTRPEAAVAHYDRTLRGLRRDGATGVRAVAVLPACETVGAWERWIAYEAIVNRALAHHDAWIVCAYDTRVVHGEVVQEMRRTHPQEGGCACHGYEDPAAVVRALTTPEPEPLAQLRTLPSAADAPELRMQLSAVMSEAGVGRERISEMLLAATEVFTNAGRHGRGLRTVRTGLVGERFVCEIGDRGPGLDDPFAGHLPPRDGDLGGFGLWVARQTAERVELLTTPAGLTVRLWI